MCHGAEIHHEGGRAKIVNRSFFGLCTGGEHRLLKRGDRKLAVRLTERDKSHSCAHQIRDMTLQKGGQGEAYRDALSRRADSKSDG